MNRRTWTSHLILVILLFNLSCKKNQIIEPEVILEDSLLVNILTDSYILNAAFNQTFGVVKDSIGEIYSQEILDRYQISEPLFEANINWLYREPTRIDTIFQMMLDRLDYLEEQISKDESSSGK